MTSQAEIPLALGAEISSHPGQSAPPPPSTLISTQGPEVMLTKTPESITPSPAHNASPSKTSQLSSSTSASAPAITTTDGTMITASAADAPLIHPIPTKPRSNSQLHSSRPAPPSPAPSRPNSQILSPQLLASTGFSSPSRDRAGSTSSSSRGGRRVSRSSDLSRAPSKPRPRSALGASSFLPQDADTSGASTPTNVNDPSLATTTIPEDVPVGQLRLEKHQVVIRDFAFQPEDPRFAGPGLPLSAPDQPDSRRSSQGGTQDSPDPASGSSSQKNSWSGFGLLSWRGFMSRRRGSSGSTGSPADDEDDFTHNEPDHYEDDYAFSDSEAASGSDAGEPWGFYHAAYTFEAVGEHEMDMEEGDLVEVRGRGGGDGWVVAIRRKTDEEGRVIRLDDMDPGEAKEGLVPESYIEKAGDLTMAPAKETEAEAEKELLEEGVQGDAEKPSAELSETAHRDVEEELAKQMTMTL